MIIVGIDPGLDGAFSIFDGDKCVYAAKIPHIDKTPNLIEVADTLYDLTLAYCPNWVFCEQVHSTPNDGHVGAFTFGAGYGYIQGFCKGRNWLLDLVRPVKWKSIVLKDKMGLQGQAIKYLQKYYPGYNPKNKAVNKATTLAHVHEKYPDIDLTPGRSRLPQDGIADAVCLGEYGVICGRQ